MYCLECNCTYQGWSGQCPTCRSKLVEGAPAPKRGSIAQVDYADLLRMVDEQGGALEVRVSTVDVETERRWRFPYSGFGFAWAAQMASESGKLPVELGVTGVGRDSRHRFPYRGYGFAWEREIEGNVAGSPLNMVARDVASDRRTTFMWRGLGYAWTTSWEGSCGPSLVATMTTEAVGRKRGASFLYRGFGFAWVREAVLSLTLSGQAEPTRWSPAEP